MVAAEVNSVLYVGPPPTTRNPGQTMNQPLPMLDQSVTTSLRRPVELSEVFDRGEGSPGEAREALASLVRRFRPEIEAILYEESSRYVA
jgi:hypothetical protein